MGGCIGFLARDKGRRTIGRVGAVVSEMQRLGRRDVAGFGFLWAWGERRGRRSSERRGRWSSGRRKGLGFISFLGLVRITLGLDDVEERDGGVAPGGQGFGVLVVEGKGAKADSMEAAQISELPLYSALALVGLQDVDDTDAQHARVAHVGDTGSRAE